MDFSCKQKAKTDSTDHRSMKQEWHTIESTDQEYLIIAICWDTVAPVLIFYFLSNR